MTEVRFVPRHQESLDDLYKALNDCQALHPDPDVSDSPDEGVADEFDNEGNDSIVIN